MNIEIELITPEIARQWIDKFNTNNRPLNNQTVDFYADQLKRGEWQLTHQGIAFDEEGVLLDGQHRLIAICKSGIAARSMVIRGAPRQSFAVLDTGRKRSGKDVLSLENEKNALHLAAALRGLYLYQSSPDTSWFGSKSLVSNNQLIDILDENPGMREAVVKGANINRAIPITTTAAAIGWYVTTRARPDIDQTPWYEGLVFGADLKRHDPRLALRNAMISQSGNKATRKREDSRGQLFLYVKAWNAWVEGREMQLLRRSKGEKMPKPTTRRHHAHGPSGESEPEGI